jgi:hypothetical protein
MKLVTYGIGGFDPSKPNNNIVEEVDLPEAIEPTLEEKLASIGISTDELKALLGI